MTPSAYEITHVSIPLGETGIKINLGYAIAGFLPVGLYFDYNQDGLIDSEFALRFIEEMPFGRAF